MKILKTAYSVAMVGVILLCGTAAAQSKNQPKETTKDERAQVGRYTATTGITKDGVSYVVIVDTTNGKIKTITPAEVPPPQIPPEPVGGFGNYLGGLGGLGGYGTTFGFSNLGVTDFTLVNPLTGESQLLTIPMLSTPRSTVRGYRSGIWKTTYGRGVE